MIENLVDSALITYSWTDNRGDPVQSDVMQLSSTNTTLTLEFSPLSLSDGGQFICTASIMIPGISVVKRNSEAYNIIIQSNACDKIIFCFRVLSSFQHHNQMS